MRILIVFYFQVGGVMQGTSTGELECVHELLFPIVASRDRSRLLSHSKVSGVK